MATIKLCTDLEQSKKLAEILPLESADMYWWSTSLRYYIEAIDDGDFNEEEGHIRAWSLAALLGVLPTKLQIVLAINNFQGDRKEKYAIGSVEHDKYDCFADNPVDACYEMILKLHELNLL